MFDPSILDQLSLDYRDLAISGLKSLYISGALQMQIRQRESQLVAALGVEDANELAADIMKFREMKDLFLSLDELGRQFSSGEKK